MSSRQGVVRQTGRVTPSSAAVYPSVGKRTHAEPVLWNLSDAELKRGKHCWSVKGFLAPPGTDWLRGDEDRESALEQTDKLSGEAIATTRGFF